MFQISIEPNKCGIITLGYTIGELLKMFKPIVDEAKY